MAIELLKLNIKNTISTTVLLLKFPNGQALSLAI